MPLWFNWFKHYYYCIMSAKWVCTGWYIYWLIHFKKQLLVDVVWPNKNIWKSVLNKATTKILFQKTKDSTLLYGGWLGHLRSCYNTSTWPSFLITLTSLLNAWPNFSKSRSSFWFSLKASKAYWTSVRKPRPRVLKEIVSRAFFRKEAFKIW